MLAESEVRYVYEHYIHTKEEKCEAAANAQSTPVGHGYMLYMDNYYNSISLAKNLLNTMTYMCGTIESMRQNSFNELS